MTRVPAVHQTPRSQTVLGGSPTEKALKRFLEGIPGVDTVGAEARAAGFNTRSLKTSTKKWGLDTIISMVDLTTLEGADTPGKVRTLAKKATMPDPHDLTAPHVAAVCVYGDMVAETREALGDWHVSKRPGGVAVAAVATAFPSGRASLPVKILDTTFAVSEGADEIGAFELLDAQVHAFQVLGEHPVFAVAFGELADVFGRQCNSGVEVFEGDFFGFPLFEFEADLGDQVGAEGDGVLVVGEQVAGEHGMTGEKIGMKPAGGIRASKDALRYLVAVAETVGEEWLTPNLFRFGASSLLNDVVMQRQKMTTGHYSGPDYVSVD